MPKMDFPLILTIAGGLFTLSGVALKSQADRKSKADATEKEDEWKRTLDTANEKLQATSEQLVASNEDQKRMIAITSQQQAALVATKNELQHAIEIAGKIPNITPATQAILNNEDGSAAAYDEIQKQLNELPDAIKQELSARMKAEAAKAEEKAQAEKLSIAYAGQLKRIEKTILEALAQAEKQGLGGGVVRSERLKELPAAMLGQSTTGMQAWDRHDLYVVEYQNKSIIVVRFVQGVMPSAKTASSVPIPFFEISGIHGDMMISFTSATPQTLDGLAVSANFGKDTNEGLKNPYMSQIIALNNRFAAADITEAELISRAVIVLAGQNAAKAVTR